MPKLTAPRERLMQAIALGRVHRHHGGAIVWYLDDHDMRGIDVTDRVLALQHLGWAGFRAHEHAVYVGTRPVALTYLGEQKLGITAEVDA